MMYRCGYSYKDVGQEKVLAIRMRHEDLRRLLEMGVVCEGRGLTVGCCSCSCLFFFFFFLCFLFFCEPFLGMGAGKRLGTCKMVLFSWTESRMLEEMC